jgi:hypothetical protein
MKDVVMPVASQPAAVLASTVWVTLWPGLGLRLVPAFFQSIEKLGIFC